MSQTTVKTSGKLWMWDCYVVCSIYDLWQYWCSRSCCTGR